MSADEWLQVVRGRSTIRCHCLEGADEDWQCAGAAQFRKHLLIRPMPGQLTLDTRDTLRVFATPDEFRAHHARPGLPEKRVKARLGSKNEKRNRRA